MDTPEKQDEMLVVCEIPIADHLKISPEPKIVSRYYIGEQNGHIYGLYRATFQGRTLIGEDELGIPNGKSWTRTHLISKMLILGEDEGLREVDLKELQSHLPAGVLA